MVLELLIASWFTLAPPDAGGTSGEAEPSVDLSKAQRLFDDGLARYDAADYEGAIEVFTQALSEVRGQGVDDFQVRGLLLFNIGRAHVRAYEIDHDVEHLRQAQNILESFVEQANSDEYAGTIDAETLGEAEQQLAEIEQTLAGTAEEPGPTPPDSDVPPPNKRQRAIGIGLTAGGVALLGAGVGILAWGAGFGARAQAQVDGYVPPSPDLMDEALAQGEDFVADERRKGSAWMAAGGVAAAIGVVGVAIGIQQLIKAKRGNRPSMSAGVGPQGMAVMIHGRF